MDSTSLELEKSFIQLAASLKNAFGSLVHSKVFPERITLCQDMLKQTNKIDGIGKRAHNRELGLVVRPMIAYLAEIIEKPTAINSTALRTLANTIDYLYESATHGGLHDDQFPCISSQIMIVDDEPLSLRATRFVLEQGGFTVTSFESPKTALENFNAQPWDLFLFDVDMPDFDGFELCRRARQNARTSIVPVLFVTGYHASELTSRCEQSGGNDMISKPFSFPGLLQKCWTWVFWSRRSLGSTVSEQTQVNNQRP